MGSDDRRIVLGIAAVTLGFVALAWTQLAYATFDAELARLSGIEVGWLESALLALLTGVVGWAMLTGVLGVSLGIVVAHRFEWPKGAAIVLLLAAIFAELRGTARVRRARYAVRAQRAAHA